MVFINTFFYFMLIRNEYLVTEIIALFHLELILRNDFN